MKHIRGEIILSSFSCCLEPGKIHQAAVVKLCTTLSMALPSPHFFVNIAKPAAPEKPHVVREFTKPTQFIAYCKFCQEGFASENELFQHRKSHEKCPYESCKFNANGKAIAEHVQRVHLKSSTLVKIQDLTTPEQIEKWKEERRKRYPTTANILLRQQVQEERFERGEKLLVRQQRFGDSKQRNYIGDKRPDQKIEKGNKFKRTRGNDATRKTWAQRNSKKPRIENSKDFETTNLQADVGQKSKNQCKKVDNDLSEDEVRTTPSFKGTSQMKKYHEVQNLVKERAALSIIGMYGSDSTSDDEVYKVSHSKPISENTPETLVVKQDESGENEFKVIINDPAVFSDNEDPPEQAPIEHSQTEVELSQSLLKESDHPQTRRFDPKERKVHTKPTRSILDYSKLANSRPTNPFLEKLLLEDIRHERSVLLQCVNFVVRNNFFDKPVETKNELEASNQSEAV